MAVQNDAGADPSSRRVSLVYDPRVRAFVFQAALIVFVVALIYIGASNAIRNLQAQNIASGFGFLGNTAGFAISQTLIPYSVTSTYGDAFIVGLLNTLLVAAVGIVLATILGFLIGIARLSSNWLVAKVATAYVEIIRNLPLLLQLLFWYFAVVKSLPSPRESYGPLFGAYLNIRGLSLPAPVFGPGSWLFEVAIVLALVLCVGVYRAAKKRQAATGRQFPVFRTCLALILGLPLLALALAGFPITFNMPELKGFNFSGGMRVEPEFVALLLGLVLYTASFIAEIVRAGIQAVSHGQTEAV